jgi:hypothetical protein
MPSHDSTRAPARRPTARPYGEKGVAACCSGFLCRRTIRFGGNCETERPGSTGQSQLIFERITSHPPDRTEELQPWHVAKALTPLVQAA